MITKPFWLVASGIRLPLAFLSGALQFFQSVSQMIGQFLPRIFQKVLGVVLNFLFFMELDPWLFFGSAWCHYLYWFFG